MHPSSTFPEYWAGLSLSVVLGKPIPLWPISEESHNPGLDFSLKGSPDYQWNIFEQENVTRKEGERIWP